MYLFCFLFLSKPYVLDHSKSIDTPIKKYFKKLLFLVFAKNRFLLYGEGVVSELCGHVTIFFFLLTPWYLRYWYHSLVHSGSCSEKVMLGNGLKWIKIGFGALQVQHKFWLSSAKSSVQVLHQSGAPKLVYWMFDGITTEINNTLPLKKLFVLVFYICKLFFLLHL